MSLGKRLKGAFFEEEPSGAASSTSDQTGHLLPGPTASVVTVQSSLQGTVDPNMKAKLDQAILNANQVSYSEFVNFFTAMSTIPDEGTRYRAAIAAAGAKGHNAADVVRGIDVILQTLAQEERDFNANLPKQLQEKVGTRETEMAGIDQSTKDKTSQIQALQAEIQQLAARKGRLVSEIQQERSQIDDVQKRFTATVSAERSRFEAEKQRVATYGGAK